MQPIDLLHLALVSAYRPMDQFDHDEYAGVEGKGYITYLTDDWVAIMDCQPECFLLTMFNRETDETWEWRFVGKLRRLGP